MRILSGGIVRASDDSCNNAAEERGEMGLGKIWDMVSQETRNDVWQEILDSARMIRYYEALAARYHRKHVWTMCVLIGSGASAFVAFLDVLPEVIQLIATATIGVLAAWVLLTGYEKKAAIAHSISHRCRQLDVDLRELWANLRELDDAEARKKLNVVAKEINNETSRSVDAGITENRKLNETITETAYKTVKERYA